MRNSHTWCVRTRHIHVCVNNIHIFFFHNVLNFHSGSTLVCSNICYPKFLSTGRRFSARAWLAGARERKQEEQRCTVCTYHARLKRNTAYNQSAYDASRRESVEWLEIKEDQNRERKRGMYTEESERHRPRELCAFIFYYVHVGWLMFLFSFYFSFFLVYSLYSTYARSPKLLLFLFKEGVWMDLCCAVRDSLLCVEYDKSEWTMRAWSKPYMTHKRHYKRIIA